MLWPLGHRHACQRLVFIVAFAILTCAGVSFGPPSVTAAPQTCPVPASYLNLGLEDSSQLFKELTTCPRLAFPTSNRLRHLTAVQVAHVLAPHARLPPHNISATDRASAPAAVVLLFFKASGCPFSASLLPVVQCSAVFFSPDVPFIALQQEAVGPISTRGGLLLQQLGLNAAPIIRIHTGRSRFTKHSGARTLTDLVQAIGSQNGTGIAPLKSPAEAISECPASGNDTADLPCWCSPQFQVAAVTANEVARMGINLWMLGAVVFLVIVSLSQLAARRRALWHA